MPTKNALSEAFDALLKSNHPNPNLFAKTLNKIAEQDFGLFFAELTKIPLKHLAATILALPPGLFKEAVTRLPHKKIAKATAYLESDEATDFMQAIQTVDPNLHKMIYSLLQPMQQQQINRLSQYSSDEAGAYMQVEMLTATTEETLSEIKKRIAFFRKQKPMTPLVKLFVTDLQRHLIATLHFSDLLLYRDQDSIGEIVETLRPHKPLSIKGHTPIAEGVRLFEEFDLPTLAVIDDEGKLIGRILFDDVYDLIRAEEESMALKLSGIHHKTEEEFFTAQVSRLKWIFINLGAILLAVLVVDHFKETIEQIVALAVLMPIVAALGGNVGNQAVTVTVRRLALGEISFKTARKIISKELRIGIINGLIIGLVVGFLADIWFGQPMLGAVIGVAIVLNLSLAGLIGALLPITFKRLGIDPAIASPLLLTTTTDAMGFLVFLSLAEITLR